MTAWRSIQLALLALAFAAVAEEAPAPLEPPLDMSVAMEAEVGVSRAIGYLVAAQAADGSWSDHPGITAACIAALSGAGQAGASESVNRGLAYLRQQVRPDGTLGLRPGDVDVYATAIALIAFTLVGQEGDLPLIARLSNALMQNQLPRGMSYAPGGFRYHTDRYPDLSNTHWALEALFVVSTRQPDAMGDAQTRQKLWQTARRLTLACQLQEGEDVGAFTYYPLDLDETPRHDEVLAESRVWGSLTYGGAKSLIYTGLDPSSPPVQAAAKWLHAHFSVRTNPGLGKGGLYYHLYMMATTQMVLGESTRNWRHAIVDQLLTKQQGSGAWQNTDPLWMEDDPNLCTAYALLALEIILRE